ncbi:MAG: hypothetical protein ACRC0G_07240 [Fusobacteriaceae bacterium]
MYDKQILKELNEKYKGSDKILGRGGVLVFGSTMSSSRGILSTSQIEQAETLLEPEKARVFTGYEKEYGSYSNGYLKIDEDLEVISKISKFPEYPDMSYILLVRNNDGIFDIIKKNQYEDLSENYCYKYKTEVIDSLVPGDVVAKDTILYKSTSFDEDMNWRYGVNLRTVYLCDVRTTEDAFLISEEAAAKFKSPKKDNFEVVVNDNDILLNLYGNVNKYKSFPDIGEEVKRKLVCGKRRIVNDEILFSLSADRLMEATEEDENYVSHQNAIMTDINIYCNKDMNFMEETWMSMEESDPNYQIYKYYTNQVRYHREIVKTLEKVAENNRENCSHDLKFELKYTKDLISGGKFEKNDNVYSNMIIEFKLVSIHELGTGGKMVGRFGDKGVISKIMPTELMPKIKLIDGTMVPVDIVANTYGVPNRTNLGQLFEVEVGMRSDQIMYHMNTMNNDKVFELFVDFVTHINPLQSELIKAHVAGWSDIDKVDFMKDINVNEYIPTRVSPFWESLGLDLLEELDKMLLEKYGITIVKYELHNFQFGRWIKSRRTIVSGHKYFMKLKHCPESKFSARSSGFINPRGLPNKSRSNKQNKALYSNTPVRFGNQEIMLFMMGKGCEKIIHKMLMLHSSSITGRRAIGELLDMNVLDPHIDLPEDARDRNTEILKMYLRTMGISLRYDDTVINPFYMGEDEDLSDVPYRDDYNLDINKIDVMVTNDKDTVACRVLDDNTPDVAVRKRFIEENEKGIYKFINSELGE